MPTPPLLVLRALLSALALPISPPTLSATPPTLLLLLLESLLAHRLSLAPYLRHPENADDEVALAKCVLGVLAADLRIDLGVVDPRRVVRGHEAEIGAVIMALAVLARRKGVALDIESDNPADQYGYEAGYAHNYAYAPDTSHSLIDEPVDDIAVPPLRPDLDPWMYTTPPRQLVGGHGDADAQRLEPEPDEYYFEHDTTHETTSTTTSVRSPSPARGPYRAIPIGRHSSHGSSGYQYREGELGGHGRAKRGGEGPPVNFAPRPSRTVLQTLIDEFGLVPE